MQVINKHGRNSNFEFLPSIKKYKNMKKLIAILLCVISINVAAQDEDPYKDIKVNEIPGKPSLSETVNYINKYLKNAQKPDSNGESFYCNRLYFKNLKSMIVVQSGKLYLKTSYVSYFINIVGTVIVSENPEKCEFSIDLSEIEDIRFYLISGYKSEGCIIVAYWFVKSGESKSIMHLPLKLGSYDTTTDKYKEEDIYKAFQHLRKLIGAKEPLKF